MRRFVVFALISVCLLACPSPVRAQDCRQEFGKFRSQLDGFIAELYAVSDLAIELEYPAAVDFEGEVIEFDRKVTVLTDEELIELCDLFERSPSMIDSPRMLSDAMQIASGAGEGAGCSKPTWHHVLVVVAHIADLLASNGTMACDVFGCYDLIPPAQAACATACIAAGVLKAIKDIAEFAVGLIDDACLNEHTDSLVAEMGEIQSVQTNVETMARVVTDNLDVQTSTRASEGSVIGLASDFIDLAAKFGAPHSSIAGELGAITDELMSQEADRELFQELDLQLAIEQILQLGQTGRIATLQLPGSVGGELERVREVVAEAILTSQSAGQSIGDAMLHFNLADDQFNSSDYKSAFASYRLAYQDVVSGGAND